MPTLRPIRSVGAYHLAMPERMVRSRSPSNRVILSSFLLSGRVSQVSTRATRSSHLQKSSMVISGRCSMAGASAGGGLGAGAAGAAAWLRASAPAASSASSLAASMRGKRASPLCTV